MKRLATALLMAALVLPVAASSVQAGYSISAEASDLSSLVNAEHRRVCGSSMYRASRTNRLALWRSADMANRDYFGHVIKGTDNQVFDYLRSKGGNNLWRLAGENIAYNTAAQSNSGEFAFDQFMGSEAHRDLIRNCDFNSFGVGAYRGSAGRKYFTVVFTRQPVERVRYTRINVRSGPSSSYRRLFTIPKGSPVMGFQRRRDPAGRGYWWLSKTSRGAGWVASWQTR